MIIPSRRRFLLGATALLAAPSIVRAANLMPVSAKLYGGPCGGAMTATEAKGLTLEFLRHFKAECERQIAKDMEMFGGPVWIVPKATYDLVMAEPDPPPMIVNRLLPA